MKYELTYRWICHWFDKKKTEFFEAENDEDAKRIAKEKIKTMNKGKHENVRMPTEDDFFEVRSKEDIYFFYRLSKVIEEYT